LPCCLFLNHGRGNIDAAGTPDGALDHSVQLVSGTRHSLVQIVFVVGDSHGCTEGAAAMKNLLGGKGANLAEMCRLGIPVPSGFTISTEACTVFTEKGKAARAGDDRCRGAQGLAYVEQQMGKRFGNAADPLLLSVRSGAALRCPA
jgi:pyruvate,orthophosphate dikinase